MKKYSILLLISGLFFVLAGPISADNSPIPGDVNGDGTVDISDVVNTLQIIDGMDAVSPSFNIDVDVNSDGKIGTEEAIFLLHVVSGLRPPPTAPSTLTEGEVTSFSVAITWTDNSSDESGFGIERKTGAAGDYRQAGTVAADETGFTDTGLMESTLYYYRVYAYNANGNSGYSNEISVTTTEDSGPSPTDTLAYARAMVVGAWYYWGNSCSPPPYPRIQLSTFICPGGGMKGFERAVMDSSTTYDYLAEGTYSITETIFDEYARIDLSYTTSINIGGVVDTGPGLLGSSSFPMFYDQANDRIVYYYNTCWYALQRTVDGTNVDVDDSHCGTTIGPDDQCGTDADCGRCWYCDKSGSTNVCRYGGEGPYGCYRGWEPPD